MTTIVGSGHLPSKLYRGGPCAPAACPPHHSPRPLTGTGIRLRMQASNYRGLMKPRSNLTARGFAWYARHPFDEKLSCNSWMGAAAVSGPGLSPRLTPNGPLHTPRQPIALRRGRRLQVGAPS